MNDSPPSDLDQKIEHSPDSFSRTIAQIALFSLVLCSLLLVPMFCLPHILGMESLPQMALPGVIWLQMCNTSIRHLRVKNTQVGVVIEQTLLVAAFAGAIKLGTFLGKDMDGIIDYMNQNFAEIMVYVVCFSVAAHFRKAGNGLSDRAQVLLAPYLGFTAPASNTHRMTDLDRHTIATHEAGHAIVLGLYRDLPQHMQIVMRDKPSDSGSLGYCTGVSWDHMLDNKAYVEWDMLFCLAGIEAERNLLGEVSLGGSSDYRAWNDLAQKYLSGHDELIYFHTPMSAWQEDHNHKMLIDLKKSQQAVVQALLIENENILQLLRDQLLANKKVVGEDLLAILQKVGSIEGCPQSPMFKTVKE
jgi:hypothetical protein